MTTVQEIHNSFNSASEKLLAECRDIIANPKVKETIAAERYSKCGFPNSKPVKAAQDTASKNMKAADKIFAIEYFSTNYPSNKFITEEDVKTLCAKYSLLMGEAQNYIGDIPEKNLFEIEKFKLRKEDFQEKVSFSDTMNFFSRQLREISLGRWGMDDEDRVVVDYGGRDHGRAHGKKPEMEQPKFKICAPPTEFNMAGYEVREGYKIVYDPIVLQPVKYKDVAGYLIVSMWGEEASDEIVVNEKMN